MHTNLQVQCGWSIQAHEIGPLFCYDSEWVHGHRDIRRPQKILCFTLPAFWCTLCPNWFHTRDQAWNCTCNMCTTKIKSDGTSRYNVLQESNQPTDTVDTTCKCLQVVACFHWHNQPLMAQGIVRHKFVDTWKLELVANCCVFVQMIFRNVNTFTHRKSFKEPLTWPKYCLQLEGKEDKILSVSLINKSTTIVQQLLYSHLSNKTDW